MGEEFDIDSFDFTITTIPSYAIYYKICDADGMEMEYSDSVFSSASSVNLFIDDTTNPEVDRNVYKYKLLYEFDDVLKFGDAIDEYFKEVYINTCSITIEHNCGFRLDYKEVFLQGLMKFFKKGIYLKGGAEKDNIYVESINFSFDTFGLENIQINILGLNIIETSTLTLYNVTLCSLSSTSVPELSISTQQGALQHISITQHIGLTINNSADTSFLYTSSSLSIINLYIQDITTIETTQVGHSLIRIQNFYKCYIMSVKNLSALVQSYVLNFKNISILEVNEYVSKRKASKRISEIALSQVSTAKFNTISCTNEYNGSNTDKLISIYNTDNFIPTHTYNRVHLSNIGLFDISKSSLDIVISNSSVIGSTELLSTDDQSNINNLKLLDVEINVDSCNLNAITTLYSNSSILQSKKDIFIDIFSYTFNKSDIVSTEGSVHIKNRNIPEVANVSTPFAKFSGSIIDAEKGDITIEGSNNEAVFTDFKVVSGKIYTDKQFKTITIKYSEITSFMYEFDSYKYIFSNTHITASKFRQKSTLKFGGLLYGEIILNSDSSTKNFDITMENKAYKEKNNKHSKIAILFKNNDNINRKNEFTFIDFPLNITFNNFSNSAVIENIFNIEEIEHPSSRIISNAENILIRPGKMYSIEVEKLLKPISDISDADADMINYGQVL